MIGDRLIEGINDENAGSGETNNTTIILFDEEDATKGVEECEKSLMGKIIIEKPINNYSLQSTMQSIWGNPKSLRVEEVRDKLFQFYFEDEGSLTRA